MVLRTEDSLAILYVGVRYLPLSPCDLEATGRGVVQAVWGGARSMEVGEKLGIAHETPVYG